MPASTSRERVVGIETYFRAIKSVLDESDRDVVTFKPTTFGKQMKGLSVHDKHNLLTRAELKTFGNQLIRIALHWNDDKFYSREWICEEMGSSNTIKLKFTRRKKKNE